MPDCAADTRHLSFDAHVSANGHMDLSSALSSRAELEEALQRWQEHLALIRNVPEEELRPTERAIAEAAIIISALMIERSELRAKLESN